MALILNTGIMLLSAACCVILAILVIRQNPMKITHRAFAVLAVNIAVWIAVVAGVINAASVETVRRLILASFVAASFLPASFYLFIGLFPKGRFDGNRLFLYSLYAAGVALSVLSLAHHPLYLRDVRMLPDQPPRPEYGPLFFVFVGIAILILIVMYVNLFRKFRETSGIERRQIQYVLLGILSSSLLASLASLIGPVVGLSLEPYGPAFYVLMVGFFAYAMVRYHLLDIWVIVSRTTIYALTTSVVVLIFLGSIMVVHGGFQALTTRGPIVGIAPTILAALVIAIVLEPIKEQAQLFLNRAVLSRRYDVNQLIARASRKASESVQLDQLLESVCDDIQKTIGASPVRVLLVSEEDGNTLTTAYSSNREEIGDGTVDYGPLLDYVRKNSEPIVLERLVHARFSPQREQLATMLAELDAFLCVPLQRKAILVGILNLGPKVSRDIYTADDLIAFTAMATPLATAIENARLYRKLEEVNEHRANILANMRGGVLAVDAQGRLTTINEGAVEILGPVHVGQPMESLPAQIAQILVKTLGDRRPIRDFETVLSLPSGERIPVLVSSACLRTSSEELAGAMVIIYDLSQVKRLEQNVQRAHRLSSVGTLAAGMAHEIKNPLVSIKAFSQLLPARFDDPEFRHTFTDLIPHEVDRIDSIVTRLLHFARPRPAKFEAHDLRSIIEEVLILLENQLRKGCITVETRFPSPGLEVYGDEQQLHQVFLNLLLNAIDAMGADGTGTLRIAVEYDLMGLRRHRDDPLPEVECAKVSISDTGCGISPEGMERIFTPFYTTKDSGTGLGLSVVHGIVTEHGGAIYVDSHPGQETTFTVMLPLASRVASVRGS
jgi:signal transduction histidine kinase